MNSVKVPFQKIRSRIDKKKIVHDFISAQGEMLCKAGDDCLFRIRNLKFLDDNTLTGQFLLEEGRIFKQEDVVGNFSVGDEKMFFQTTMSVVGNTINFGLDIEIYKLQRRAHHRIEIAGKKELHWIITQFLGNEIFLTGLIQDISAGGCRIQLLRGSSVDLKKTLAKIEVGNTFKGKIHFSDTKIIEVGGIIRHIVDQKERNDGIIGEFGVEFIDLTPTIRNRISLMTLDLQKKIVLGS